VWRWGWGEADVVGREDKQEVVPPAQQLGVRLV